MRMPMFTQKDFIVYFDNENEILIDLAIEKFNSTPAETVLIGDRVYTDIAAGINAGIDTIMVLSGEGTVKETEERKIFPTVILDNIGVVADLIEKSK
mgnify:CR=1 FL=1